uniref:Plectin/eS10 N-terminal domain-containing protein n=1 Tax=Corethron hystrix TaxID=216773 RepID=A0A6U5J4G2_9STRA|mmetsp:Transcript_36018/g.84094  ORF Transcript_36018/g.84094 Transcript_36018/m.84094 type:complete len:133 (+) Transcript_36018:258-656(+)
MFIPKSHRVAVFSYLFKEGVLVFKKDPTQTHHPAIPDVTNLEVMMLAKSLTSRGFVRQTFSWQHTYCYLTEAGMAYLRRYLALPESVLPATHVVTARRPVREGGEGMGGRTGRKEQEEERLVRRGLGRGGGL